MYKKIIRFIEEESCDIRFGWIDKTTAGLYRPTRGEIIINAKLLIVQTFLHEFVHAIDKKMLDEIEVESKSWDIVERLTKKQIDEIYYLLTLYGGG